MRTSRLIDRCINLLRSVEFRGKYRLLKPFVPQAGVRQANVYGVPMQLDLSDYIQRSIYMGTMGAAEVSVVKKLLKPGHVFVDVGANVGFFTALGRSCVGPRGRVIAFEPSAYAFARLSSMIEESKLTNVTALKCALSDTCGTSTLYVPSAELGNHSPTMVCVDTCCPETVALTTLDAQLEELNIERVDLLKIDVEGHEPKVIAGARESIAGGKIRAIFCELNGHWLREAGSSPELLWQQLMDLGFRSVDFQGKQSHFAPDCIEMRLFKWVGTP